MASLGPHSYDYYSLLVAFQRGQFYNYNILARLRRYTRLKFTSEGAKENKHVWIASMKDMSITAVLITLLVCLL